VEEKNNNIMKKNLAVPEQMLFQLSWKAGDPIELEIFSTDCIYNYTVVSMVNSIL